MWKFLVLVSCRPSVDLHYEMSPSLFFRLIEHVAFGCEMSKCHGWIEACSFLYKWSIYNKGMFHKSVLWLSLYKWSSPVVDRCSESAQGVLFSFHRLTSCLDRPALCRMMRLSKINFWGKRSFCGAAESQSHDRLRWSCCSRITTRMFAGAHDRCWILD